MQVIEPKNTFSIPDARCTGLDWNKASEMMIGLKKKKKNLRGHKISGVQ